ncbi:MAG: C40 family peptidase, partial [Vicinamibacterales bacterium]
APTEPVPVANVAAYVSGTDGDGLNVRDGAGTEATVLTAIPEGMDVLIVGGPATDAGGATWYQVDAGGTVGWVHGDYLAITEIPSDIEGDPGGAIAVEALLYLGTPYVWAGTEPGGFDCSGFTYFIVNKVLDNGFPRVIEEQIAFGSHVEPAELQPGDLVFFQNTYKEGLSHVGIYIGGGQFVNAGSENDDVGISNLWDEYWAPRYLEGRRVH